MLEKKTKVDQVMYDARVDQIAVRESVTVEDEGVVISSTYNRYWVTRDTDISTITDENVLKAINAYF